MAETFVNIALIMLPAALLGGICGIYCFFAEYLPQKIADRRTSPASQKRNRTTNSVMQKNNTVKRKMI